MQQEADYKHNVKTKKLDLFCSRRWPFPFGRAQLQLTFQKKAFVVISCILTNGGKQKYRKWLQALFSIWKEIPREIINRTKTNKQIRMLQ